MKIWQIRQLGSEKSGHYGHKGRPGHRGGSAPSGGSVVRGMLVTLGMEEYDDTVLDQVASSIAESGKFNPDMEPFSVELWRITGKRKRKVEFSVSYHRHPLGISGNFYTTKLVTPLLGES